MKKEYYSVPEFGVDPHIFENLPIITQGVEGFEDGTIVGHVENVIIDDTRVKATIEIDKHRIYDILNNE